MFHLRVFWHVISCSGLFTAITVPPSWIWWQEHKRWELEWNGTCCSLCVQPPLPSEKSERSSFPIFFEGRGGCTQAIIPFHGSFSKFLVNGKRPRSAPISVINYKPLEVYSLFGTSKVFLWIQLHISVNWLIWEILKDNTHKGRLICHFLSFFFLFTGNAKRLHSHGLFIRYNFCIYRSNLISGKNFLT